jgi:hypothetical protein
MNANRSFRDKLLAVAPLAPDIRAQLQQETHDMLVRKLTVPRRIVLCTVMLFALASAGVCGFLAATEATLPPLARIGLATGVVFGLGWMIALGSILRRGEIHLKLDGRRIAQMVWCFTLLMVIFFVVVGMSAADRLMGLLMIAQSLVFLIGAAVYWLNFRIEEAELTVREKMLQLELQICELAKQAANR